ncbi:hypothetical protein FACS1894163_06480 [Spirochaetia bacterium]|nr:hypothetical protein FACS1894163_06480 [Spirochaetia bacterium]
MNITVKILNVRGESTGWDELWSLFASDMNYVPWRRKHEISQNGTITLTVPGGPVILQAKLFIPGYGFMWVSADNCGIGYRDGSIRREIDRVITDRVHHFKDRIFYYDVINEAHDWCNSWNMGQQELVDMTAACADAVHNADSRCNAIVNTCFMFGENAADGRVQWGTVNERNMVPYSYPEKLAESGGALRDKKKTEPQKKGFTGCGN